MQIIQKASSRLDAVFRLIKETNKVTTETRQYLQNQALIYASYLSDAVTGKIKVDADQQMVMAELTGAFCDLVERELGVA